jgi:hypothetical protein
MDDRKPNFVLVPDSQPGPGARKRTGAGKQTGGTVPERLRSWTRAITALLPAGALAVIVTDRSGLKTAEETARRPRLVFGFDATASREPAWAMARTVTDALVRALPGELDVALAVHGGSRLHTFTDFTADANALRDRAASVACRAGQTQLLPILATSLKRPGVRVVTYIGDVYEESLARGRKLADALGREGIKLIVLHDTSDWSARRDAETFLDLARRTGGCVLPFDVTAPGKLRDLLGAIAVFAVGGAELLEEKRGHLPGAVMLLEHLRPKR